jgi:hypothetical protein
MIIICFHFYNHAGPPAPGTLAAFEKGIMDPFRRPEYLQEINDLKKELAYIEKIHVAKNRVGALLSQVLLSVLIGLSSFFFSWLYDSRLADIVGDDNNDDLFPVVSMLGPDSENDESTTFSVLENILKVLNKSNGN